MSAENREINRDHAHIKDHIAEAMSSLSLAMNMFVSIEKRDKDRRRSTDKEESK